MRPRHPVRLATFDYRGPHQYFLTFCVDGRRHAFVQPAAVALVRSHFLRVAAEQEFAVIAYCFMPDHVHLLIEGLAPRSDARVFITQAKQRAGFHYRQTFGARLWQRYAYDHVLRRDEATFGVARYILENPVRAGLVERPADYPFSGSTLYSVEELCEAIQMMPVWQRFRGDE